MSKILNVVNIYFTLPYFLGDQLSYFTQLGNEIHLICSPAKQLPGFAEKHGCKWKEIEITRNFDIISDLKAIYKLLKYIRHYKFDIVSGHTPKAGMLTMIAAKIAGVKQRIYFRHGLVYETSIGLKHTILVWSERLASWCSTKTVCVSPYLLERSINDKLSSKKKLIILNIGSCTGIDANKYFNPSNYSESQKNGLRSSLNIPHDAFVIGYVGRMVKDKGIVELVEAYDKLHIIYPKAYLLLIGPLEERDALPNTVVEHISQERTIVNVGLIEDNMPLFYSIMDLFVLPTHREGLGVALLEAQSMGVPVLTTSNTGARDAILPGVTGEYIDTTPESIFEKAEQYIINSKLGEKQGKAGREFILDNFLQENIWREIEKLYNE